MSRHLGAALLAATVAVAVTACSGGSSSEQDRPLVGLLRVIPDEDHPAFVDELRAQGWRDGADVDVVPDDPDDVAADPDQARRQLEQWVRDGVDLIVASSTPYATLAAEIAPDVPILFLVNDPVAAGLVEDPARPEGHLTGLTFRTPADRTLVLAGEVLGSELQRVGYLAPAGDLAVAGHRAGVAAAAEALGIELVEATFDGPAAVSAAVDELAAGAVEVVYLASANATVEAMDVLEVELLGAGLPVVTNTDYLPFALVSLAPASEEVRRQLARQAARLLGGADVSSVPVEHPRRFVITVDRGVAERFGIGPIDPAVLRQADVVR